ncbi:MULTISPECIES: THUMP-like domain-containing protein [Nocardia]|uniref:Class I SAM-dependent methyltransferase n=1 Tax=Nocardia implantans TaxID=3108168 RepID=A0ABU6AT05_9NOCA|nr:MULTISPECIES: class I SAM-dependent methyltransferase [unclassified Nocardia]MBF6190960.1 class I SAM-dependent methyltransferase [Nocardia beijingensis]MEA3528951.1 class I SAM-dependent methyltransferase [Nocardia sp. CDC192]MEB3510616.1 class I SAM-dependent methyltransferase [Nocardia sp. CDC186]
MAYRFTRDDVGYLDSATGRAALTEVDGLALTSASLLKDLELVRRAHGDRAAALVETVRLRRRATAKLAGAGEWLFTDDALQQATPTAVAEHRAARLAGRAVHDVTCSIGAELAALAPHCPAVLGSDLDDVRLAMSARNLSGRRNVLLAKADALRPCSAGTVVIADPARRADGRRTHDPAKLQPPLPDLLDTYRGRDLAVKCAPGLDFDRLAWPGEVEVVSLDGSVREACLWSPGLAEAGVTRRATVLSAGAAAWTITDADSDVIDERPPGQWIIDPDGAVVRSGLVRHYAAKHGLWQLDPRIAYLTGDAVPEGVRGFRVLDRMDLREKALRAELHRRDCGPLEILARGVDVDPDALRSRLKPRGSRPHTLVITRIGRTATVFLCATP